MLIFSLQINLIEVFDLEGVDWLKGYVSSSFGTFIIIIIIIIEIYRYRLTVGL